MVSKSVILVALTLVLIASLLISACSGPSSPTASSKPSTASSIPASAASPAAAGARILKLGYTMPKSGSPVPGYEWFASELTQRSNGKIKVDVYPAGSLAGESEAPDALKSGLVDIQQLALATNATKFPLVALFNLPAVHFPDTLEGFVAMAQTAEDLMAKYPSMRDQFKDYKFLVWSGSPANFVMTKKVKVAVPDDIKGLKLAAAGMDRQIAQLANAAPVNLSPPDMYEALEKGVVDGCFASWIHVATSHFDDIVNYFNDYTFGQNAQMLLMNLNTWNSLSPDIQKVITDIVPETHTRCHDGYNPAKNPPIVSGKKQVESNKNKIITITTPEQRKLWDNLVLPLEQDWVNSMKSKGFNDAENILKDAKQKSLESWSKNK